MTNLTFEFNAEKAREAILYLAKRTKKSPTYMRIVKLMYLADKTSLEQYGRFISGDTYYAMQHGPVPTHSFNMLKEEDTNDNGFEVVTNKYPTIIAHRDANIDYLSESDTLCLDQILESFDKFPTFYLRDITHDEAWEATWKENGEAGSREIPLERIAELLENGEALIEHLRTLNS
ncbi:MAG: Panacea domain-containing protein [Chloroflexota bacterium]